jgi:hypothetical protein
MILVDVYKINPLVSLGIISAMLGAAVIASVLANRRDGGIHEAADGHGVAPLAGAEPHATKAA